MRLRIGMVGHGALGGSGAVAIDLAVGLSKRGHEVHMITPRRPFRLQDDDDVVVHELAKAPHAMWDTAPWGFALASRVAEVAAEFQLDVLHAHFGMPYAVSTELACRMLGDNAPLWGATLHGSDVAPLGLNPSYGPVMKYALSRADWVTVPSRYLQKAADHLVTPKAIVVIPNFVDDARFTTAPTRGLPTDSEAVVVHASNFRAVKRVQDVVAIFEKLAARMPARLLLVGDGPERAPALKALDDLGLSDRVEAPGAEREVERWLRRAHVALLPSEQESFGLAALEALACGVPVIGSRVGGLPEVVTHGKTGLLLPVGDVEQMAQSAYDLLVDGARWRDMAAAARAHAQANFAPTLALDDYEAVYRGAVGPSAGVPTSRRPMIHGA